VDCARARTELGRAAKRLRDHGRRAVLERARALAALSRAPTEQLERQRARLHQQLREIRAGTRRRLAGERALTQRRGVVLERKTQAAIVDCRRRRSRDLERLALALAAHDPQRTLERGYALVESTTGEPLASAARTRAQERVRLRFADGTVRAGIEEGS
jgi:exodeoxyribonuclease VII large subunit